jgi:hypothetical protein
MIALTNSPRSTGPVSVFSVFPLMLAPRSDDSFTTCSHRLGILKLMFSVSPSVDVVFWFLLPSPSAAVAGGFAGRSLLRRRFDFGGRLSACAPLSAGSVSRRLAADCQTNDVAEVFDVAQHRGDVFRRPTGHFDTVNLHVHSAFDQFTHQLYTHRQISNML